MVESEAGELLQWTEWLVRKTFQKLGRQEMELLNIQTWTPMEF